METLTIILLLVGFFVLKSTVFSSKKTSNPLQSSSESSNGTTSDTTKWKPILEGKFTPKTLYKFNGFDSELIYIAVCGKVYDVTKARQFYGPSGPYSNFAGHDASRGLLLNSFDMEVVRSFDEPIDDLQGLSELELLSLKGWEEHFANKYTCVGELVEN